MWLGRGAVRRLFAELCCVAVCFVAGGRGFGSCLGEWGLHSSAGGTGGRATCVGHENARTVVGQLCGSSEARRARRGQCNFSEMLSPRVVRSNFAQTLPQRRVSNSADMWGPRPAESGRTRSACAHTLLGQLRPTSADPFCPEAGRTRRATRFGQGSTTFGAISKPSFCPGFGPSSTKAGHILTNLGTEPNSFDQQLPRLGQTWLGIDQYWPELDQLWPVWPDFGQIWSIWRGGAICILARILSGEVHVFGNLQVDSSLSGSLVQPVSHRGTDRPIDWPSDRPTGRPTKVASREAAQYVQLAGPPPPMARPRIYDAATSTVPGQRGARR